MNNETMLFDLLTQRFGKVKATGNGWLRIPCPTCTEHNRNKFKRYISATSRYSNCFICQVKTEVQDLLGGHYKPTYDPTIQRPVFEKKIDPRAFELPYHRAIPVNELPVSHPAIKFLHKDYLYDLDTYANKHKIVYVPSTGGKVFNSFKPFTTSAERLVFPVYESEKLVGWQMRSIPDTFYGDREDVIRYYHLFDKGSHLYNYENAKQFDFVVVVEGVKKALKFPNGVATWGAGISGKQLQLIQEWDKIVMMLDGEDHNNTQRKAIEFVEGFKAVGKQAINIDLRHYGATSPDDLPADTLQEIVKEEWRDRRNRV